MKASWQGASNFSFPGITFIIYLLFVVQICFQELKQLECSFLLKFNPSVWEPSIYQGEFGTIQKLVKKKKNDCNYFGDGREKRGEIFIISIYAQQTHKCFQNRFELILCLALFHFRF